MKKPAPPQRSPQRPTQQPQQQVTAPSIVPSQVPAEVDEEFEREVRSRSGMGVSTDPADNLVPSITVLQPLSPRVLDHEAEAGDILLTGVNTTIPGKDGFWFQPCEKYDKWMEFVPRDNGGGFVAAYDFKLGAIDREHPPKGAEFDPDNRNRAYFPDSGHECVHYHFVAGFVWENGNPLEYVIPFKGTGHSIAKSWNTVRMRQRFEDGTPKPAPMFVYHLTTVAKRNKKGQWFVFEVGAPVSIKEDKEGLQIVGNDYRKAWRMGVLLADAITAGQKQIRVEQDQGEEELPDANYDNQPEDATM